VKSNHLKNSKKTPPKFNTFYWGASTSAHQVEGGNHNSWTQWEQTVAPTLAQNFAKHFTHLPKDVFTRVSVDAQNPQNYLSQKSTQHYSSYLEDINLMRSLNFNAYRFSIEWSRIEPFKGQWDLREVKHYRTKIQSLRQADIEPFITLWHWTHPIWFEEAGGWANPTAVKSFVNYVQFITQELGNEVSFWITMNEPQIYTSMSYIYGLWPPQKKHVPQAYQVFRRLVQAHQMSYRLIKQAFPTSFVGIAENIAYSQPANSKILTQLHRIFSQYIDHLFLNATKRELDFIGLNYYFRNLIDGLWIKNPHQKVSDLGWDMYPSGLYHVIDEISKYQKPIIITENGLADAQDTYRQWWLEESMHALERSKSEGKNIFGYLHWSLLDNFEWDKGYWPRFGLIEVDYASQQRTIRPSAKWYAQYIANSTW
jgi:beta-glucosidase